MRRAFSIAELMIVVCVIGILAAIVLPALQNNATEAKVIAAKDNLRALRGAIELYAAGHKGVPPGYPDNDLSSHPTPDDFVRQVTIEKTYLPMIPRNPFNELNTINVLGNGEALPAEAAGDYGWIYKPSSRTVLLDWPGQDDKAVRYFDY